MTRREQLQELQEVRNLQNVPQRGPWWAKLWIALVLTAVTLFSVGSVGWAMPFQPFKLYGWHDIPEKVCPLERINTTYTYEVESGPYALATLEGQATIVTEGGRIIDTWQFPPQQLQPTVKTTSPSLVQRTAPATPGKYRLGTDLVVRGRMFGLVPTYQELTHVSTKTFEVVDINDPSCGAQALPQPAG